MGGDVTISAILKEIGQNQFVYTVFLICVYALVYRLLIWSLSIIVKLNKKISLNKNNRKKTTIFLLLRNLCKYLIISIAFINILDVYGVNTEKIIAGLGIAGLVVGLAFQDVLKDFLAGLFIIIDEQYAVGDTILVNSYKGEVLSIGLKTTKIKTISGEICSLANRNIMEVTNFSTQFSLAIIDVNVSFEEDEQRVSKTIEKILPKLKEIKEIKGNIEFLGIDNFTEIGMTYRITAECIPLKQAIVKREVLRYVKDAFGAAGISFAKLGAGDNSVKLPIK